MYIADAKKQVNGRIVHEIRRFKTWAETEAWSFELLSRPLTGGKPGEREYLSVYCTSAYPYFPDCSIEETSHV